MEIPDFIRKYSAIPETIRVAVDFYDNEHKKKLTSGNYPSSLQRIAGTTVEIPTADFFAYYLIATKQRLSPELYKQLTQVRENQIFEAVGELNNLITLQHGTVHAESDIEESTPNLTGKVGEAISLCVMDRIHDTGVGDWLALPEKIHQIPKGLRPMDFRIVTASDGHQVVQVEAKASFMAPESDTSDKKLRDHARDIADKKKIHNIVPQAKKGIWAADLRYGSIAVFGREGDSDAECWLLDPPAESNESPESFRIRARILNSTRFLRLAAPRSHLAIAATNRAAAVLSSNTVYDFNRVPLLRANGESFSDLFSRTGDDGEAASNFFTDRTTVDNYPAGGRVIYRQGIPPIFIGIREDLGRLIANQNFNELINYKAKPELFKASISAVIPKGEAEAMGYEVSDEKGQYLNAQMVGMVFTSSAGFVFGFMDFQYEYEN